MEYLDHSINAEGIKPKEDLIKALREVRAPSNKEELKSFIELSDHYSRFMEGYATLMEPLKKMLREKVRFFGGREENKMFEEIKDILTKVPVLKTHINGHTCVITEDQSTVGLGAIYANVLAMRTTP
ncbi:hypothetical protein NDU88_005030 [Pleurodeles waltl]|uniref:Reverse transcriptase/retrotransposon-derived protein RNase H-like domain-containing protein n=1 Tax=Pleurodeles waltl TaxID=8319 RepID=A0AAV7RM49_PLEWA|nr:hypothetical protein NDU88_005030 [Pleurodeles waltl]